MGFVSRYQIQLVYATGAWTAAPSYYFSRTETETRLRRSPAPGHSDYITKNDLALVQMSPSPVSRPPTSCASKHTKESYMKTKMEINNVKDAVYGERIIGSRLAALRYFASNFPIEFGHAQTADLLATA